MKLLLLAIGISNLDNSSEFELVIVELFIFLLSPANTNYLSLQISVWKKVVKSEKIGHFCWGQLFLIASWHLILPPDCKELLMRQHPLAPFAPFAPHQPEVLVFIAARWPVWYRHQQFCFLCYHHTGLLLVVTWSLLQCFGLDCDQTSWEIFLTPNPSSWKKATGAPLKTLFIGFNDFFFWCACMAFATCDNVSLILLWSQPLECESWKHCNIIQVLTLVKFFGVS